MAVTKLRAPRPNMHSPDTYDRALSATFTHGNGLRRSHTAITSVDDVLELVRRQAKAKAVRKRHREEAGNPPPSKAALFALAKAQAASPRARNAVKLPVFSIQQREETDA